MDVKEDGKERKRELKIGRRWQEESRRKREGKQREKRNDCKNVRKRRREGKQLRINRKTIEFGEREEDDRKKKRVRKNEGKGKNVRGSSHTRGNQVEG